LKSAGNRPRRARWSALSPLGPPSIRHVIGGRTEVAEGGHFPSSMSAMGLRQEPEARVYRQ
jgi:hypothetical protein